MGPGTWTAEIGPHRIAEVGRGCSMPVRTGPRECRLRNLEEGLQVKTVSE